MLDAMKRLMSALVASVRTYMWYWAGGAAVVVAGVAALLIFGGFFGPSGRTVCEIARFQAVQYGVLPSDAKLQGSGKAAKVKGRRECTLASGGETFVATAELTCKDVKKELAEMKAIKAGKEIPAALLGDPDRCFSLYAVERTNGLTLYQKRAVPDDAGDDAVAGGTQTDGGDGTNGEAAPPAQDTNQQDIEVVHPAAPQQ